MHGLGLGTSAINLPFPRVKNAREPRTKLAREMRCFGAYLPLPYITVPSVHATASFESPDPPSPPRNKSGPSDLLDDIPSRPMNCAISCDLTTVYLNLADLRLAMLWLDRGNCRKKASRNTYRSYKSPTEPGLASYIPQDRRSTRRSCLHPSYNIFLHDAGLAFINHRLII